MKDANLAQRTSRGLAETVPNLCFLGGACWAMWVMLIYGGGMTVVATGSEEALARSYIVSTVFFALAALAIAVGGSRSRRLCASVPLMALCGVLAALGTGLALWGAGADSVAALYGGNVLTGLGTGCIALRCATQFAELPPRTAIIMTALMMACALVACALFLTLAPPALSAVMIVLPLAAVLFSFIKPTSAASGRSASLRDLSASDVASVLLIFLLVLLLFLLSGIVPSALDYEAFSIRSSSCVLTAVALMAGFVVVAALVPEGFRFERLYYLAILVLLIFYVVIAVGQIRLEGLTLFFSTASITLNVVVWGFLCCLAYYADRLAVPVLGFGWAVVSLGVTMGRLVGAYAVVGDARMLAAVLALGVVACIAVASILVFRREGSAPFFPVAEDFDAVARSASDGGRAEEAESPGDIEPSAPSAEPASATPLIRPRWRLKMLMLAEQCQLTRRETEVFLLLAKGKDAQSIADELCISLSTARTHVRGIYLKCDVHSRREFQHFIESGAAEMEEE